MADVEELVPLPATAEELLERYLKKRRMRERFDREVDDAIRYAARGTKPRKPYKPRPYKRRGPRAPRPKTPPMEVELTCAYCEKKFWRPRSVERQRQKAGGGGPYCSIACAAKGRTKNYVCPGCGTSFLSPNTKPVGVRRKGEVYCSKECYLEERDRLDGTVPVERFVPPIERPLEGKTYCHHCIDHDATCELLLNERWMAICDKCREAFVTGVASASFPSIGESVPWPKGPKRKPMLHEIDRKGSRATLNTGLMILTLEWVRP